ncbi:hypothetical protein EVAR_39984_1 [Eumeta japonica]|uniref:Uncharacterized protein n=1 Tax=Eumeta variegata TaxID=151549 RepID=A0A4C1YDX0_EUMVA|nr:hypothetical protein EVAR_39984_1 [Eumeta japonica]
MRVISGLELRLGLRTSRGTRATPDRRAGRGQRAAAKCRGRGAARERNGNGENHVNDLTTSPGRRTMAALRKITLGRPQRHLRIPNPASEKGKAESKTGTGAEIGSGNSTRIKIETGTRNRQQIQKMKERTECPRERATDRKLVCLSRDRGPSVLKTSTRDLGLFVLHAIISHVAVAIALSSFTKRKRISICGSSFETVQYYRL